MAQTDPDQLRATSRDAWETAAAGWGREADAVRTWGHHARVGDDQKRRRVDDDEVILRPDDVQ